MRARSNQYLSGPRGRVYVTLACWAITLAGCSPTLLPIDAPLTAEDPLTAPALQGPLNVLANPQLGGRMTGTPGHDSAAKYIAKQFRQAGLIGGLAPNDYYQEFVVGNLRQPGPLSELVIGEQAFRLGRDFYPMAMGAEGSFDGPVVFAGYGLRYGLKMYDDYEDLSVQGAVALILQGEPHDENGQSLWKHDGWTTMGTLAYKIRKAADLGATAVLVVTPPAMGEPDPLYNVMPTTRRGKIPVVRISRTLANHILASTGKGLTVASLAEKINRSEQPASLPTPANARGVVELAPGYGQNVIGILPADPERFGQPGQHRPAIVLGAHYDHLSVMGFGKSRDKGWAVRPGADDNASGVAVLIQLAHSLSQFSTRGCDYVFVAFSGEEIGFLGSKHYVAHPVIPLKQTAAMLNFDQIGRLKNNRLYVIGNVWDQPFRSIISLANPQMAPLKITALPVKNSNYWSDNASFVTKGVATLFFFTGLTQDYHTRNDVRETINVEGLSRVGRYALNVICYLDAAFVPPVLPAVAPGP